MQNPNVLCPESVMRSLGVLTVEYLGFDRHIHVGQLVIAQSVMAEVDAFFRQALEERFPIAKVVPAADARYSWNDEKLMSENISSGFNYRLIAGTNLLSSHALGMAFDINPVQNPYIRYEKGQKTVSPHGATWELDEPGTLHGNHPLVMLMEGFGWDWGGHWTPESGRTDYQHFQKAFTKR